MVYLKSVENVKLIGLLFLFCLPLLSILFLKTKMNDLARPVYNGNHFSSTIVSMVPRTALGSAAISAVVFCCCYSYTNLRHFLLTANGRARISL